MSGFVVRWGLVAIVCAAVAGVGVACSGEGGADPAEPVDEAPILDDDFRFCHDPEADDPALLEYCPLLEHAPADACPGLRAACADAEPDAAPPPPPSGCDGEGREARSEVPTAPKPPPEPYEPPSLVAGEALVQLVRWTVAILVAVALVALLYLVGRTLLRFIGRDRAIGTPEPERAAVVLDLPDVDAVPDAPSGDLLEAARRALDEGRLGDAVLFARGAALRALGDRGELRLHRSRTDREYVRALRRDRERQGRLRSIVRAVEAVRWGGRPLDRDTAREAVEAAVGLATAVVLLVGLLAPRAAHAADEYRVGGRAALVAVYDAWGFEASWRLRTVRTLDHEVDLLVLDADLLAMDEEDERALRSWVEAGGVLVLAGELDVFPELGRLERVPGSGTTAVSREARDLGLAAPVWPGGPSWLYRGARGEVLVLVRPDDDSVAPGALVQALSVERGGVLAIADARVLDNGSLIVPANVAFVGGGPWIGSYLGAYELYEDATLEIANATGAPGAQSPIASLSNARLLPLVAQILLLLGVVALWRGWPFGPLRDPPTEGRRVFADHARALGHRFYSVGATRHVASAHADLWLRRLGPVALTAAAERHGMEPEEARRLVERLQRLADDPDGPNEAVDIRIVEELWRITRT